MGECPKSRPEIIEGDGATHGDDPPDEGVTLVDVTHDRRLGDLEHEVGRVGPTLLDLLFDQGEEVEGHERLGRQIGSDVPPCRSQTDGLLDDPLIDLGDQAVLLGHPQERVRSDDLTASPDHAEEKLLAGLTSAEGDDGLGVQDQPVLVQRLTDSPDPAERGQLTLDAEPFRVLRTDVPKDDHGASRRRTVRSGEAEMATGSTDPFLQRYT